MVVLLLSEVDTLITCAFGRREYKNDNVIVFASNKSIRCILPWKWPNRPPKIATISNLNSCSCKFILLFFITLLIFVQPLRFGIFVMTIMAVENMSEDESEGGCQVPVSRDGTRVVDRYFRKRPLYRYI